uniref:Uncharacterized protein n=1 Tax=Arion vulgaris TaxID=1028688 RepID=A0A0B6Y609_9EUPU
MEQKNEQQDVADLVKMVSKTVEQMDAVMRQQSITASVTPFSGKSGECRQWLAQIDKYAFITEINEFEKKKIAFQTCVGLT